MDNEQLTIEVVADTQGFESALDNLRKQASSFGNTLTGALRSAIVSGKSLEDTLRSIALSMAGSALNAGLAPLQNLLNGVGSRIMGSILPMTPFAAGGVPGRNGIVSVPTTFAMPGGMGLMGEAGSEAIMPLKRGPDGQLGVASSGGGRPVQVTVNISTPDVESFQRSSGQVSAAMARAVRRGQRSL